jgi:hypothetical protein
MTQTIDNGEKDPTLFCLLSTLISSPESTVITMTNATTEQSKGDGDGENAPTSTKAICIFIVESK